MNATYTELTEKEFSEAITSFGQVFNRIAKKYPSDIEAVRVKNTNITWEQGMSYEIMGNEKPPRLETQDGVSDAFEAELMKEFKRLFRV